MRETTKMLLAFLGPYRVVATALVCLGFLASLSEGIGIGLFIPFLQALGPEGAPEVQDSLLGTTLGRLFDDIAPENRLPIIALTILGAVLVKAALTYATTLLFTLLSARNGHDLRTGVFDRVLATDTRSLDKTGSGRLLNVLSRESWRTAALH